jgi:hypothetical protein
MICSKGLEGSKILELPDLVLHFLVVSFVSNGRLERGVALIHLA